MRENAAYVIGLDGGGTKTTAQLADLNGRVALETQGGPSNFQTLGVEEVAKSILDLVETCCRTVGCNISEIGSVVAGLAGAGRTIDQQRIAEGIQSAAQSRGIYLRDLKIESDARIALESAFLGNPGIVLICGTGSIAFAKTRSGKILRAGGWGRVIGDEGSGYQIGRDALRAVTKAIDGRGKKTRMVKMVSSSFGLKHHEDIVRSVYRDNLDLATVAPFVVRAAQQGDAVAKEILNASAQELLETVRAVLKGMKTKRRAMRVEISIVLIGGLMESDNWYSRKVKSLIRKSLPDIIVRKPVGQPVQGAVLIAVERAKAGPTTEKNAAAFA